MFILMAACSLQIVSAETQTTWAAHGQGTIEAGEGLETSISGPGLQYGFGEVRLIAKGENDKAFGEIEFEAVGSHIVNAVVGLKIHPAIAVQLGQYTVPLGMDINAPGGGLDLTKRGMDTPLTFDKGVGVMASGKAPYGLSYAVGLFNPATDRPVVSGGESGTDYSYAGRLMYDQGTLHVEGSFGASQHADFLSQGEDYQATDFGAQYGWNALTAKAEFILANNIEGISDNNQTTWFAHLGYKIRPNIEAVVRHYASTYDGISAGGASMSSQSLSNTFLGLNIWLLDTSRLQVNYVVVAGDNTSWSGQGGYTGNVFLIQYQVAF